MSTITDKLSEIAAALPQDMSTDVCIYRFEDGTYRCMAGGNSAVLLGEAPGKWEADGPTAEIAAELCLIEIIRRRR